MTQQFSIGLAAAALILATSCASANPAYDHVVVVVEENSGYREVVGSPNAPFINQVLIKGGVVISNAYSEQHPSQPNYFWLFSGSNQGITTDNPYWTGSPGGPVFDAPNLYTGLERKPPSPKFFGGYVDSGTDQPVANYYQDTLNYANRHVPWLGFTNINNGDPAGITQDFGTAFPCSRPGQKPDFSRLPTLSFVIPALNHDMHDYDSFGHAVSNSRQGAQAVRRGDAWLKRHLAEYAKWARTHNSLLVITFDEDSTADWPTPKSQGGGGKNGGVNPEGLTAPNLGFQATASSSGPNRIAMIFYGAHLTKRGRYKLPGVGVNNINLLRTLESFYHLPPNGAQTSLAVSAGMTDLPITGIFSE